MPNSRSRQMEPVSAAVDRVLRAVAERLYGCNQFHAPVSPVQPGAANDTPPVAPADATEAAADADMQRCAALPAKVTAFVPAVGAEPGTFVEVSPAEAARRLYARKGPMAPKIYSSMEPGWPWRVPGQG